MKSSGELTVIEVECPSCGYSELISVAPGGQHECDHCGKHFQISGVQAEELEHLQRMQKEARRLERDAQQKDAAFRQAVAAVIVSTTHALDGWRVEEYLGIESVEFVIGTGIFSEVTSDIEDFFGLRSTAFEQKLAKAKKAVFETLKTRAVRLGGNAVIGIDMDYTEFSGNRVGLIVNGTVVRVSESSFSSQS